MAVLLVNISANITTVNLCHIYICGIYIFGIYIYGIYIYINVYFTQEMQNYPMLDNLITTQRRKT